MTSFDPDDPAAVRGAEPGHPSAPASTEAGAASRLSRRERRRLRRAPEDEEFIEVKADPGPWRKLIAILLVFGIVLGALVGGAYWWYRRQVDPPGPPGAAISVVIAQGTSTSGIADELEHDGVIGNKTVFTFYVRRKNAGPFEAGRFVLHKNSDFDSVIRVLKRGPAPPQFTRVSIPEGLTVKEIASTLHKAIPRFSTAQVLQALRSGAVHSSLRQGPTGSWEGLLFPATYDVGVHTDVTTVLGQMAAKMEQVARAEGLGPASQTVAKTFGITLSPYQAFTVASLIQREAASSSDAPKIATVIYNRLQRKIALGIDATSLFLAKQTGQKIDFASPSPYNTRRQKGLPPTPIATPSRASLHAALHPTPGPWLYYVLTSRRTHTFVVTPAQFEAAKRICKAKGLGCG